MSDIPQPGEVIADKYRLGRMIGKGAAGVVFEAEHELIGKRVALKWLYPQLAQNPTVAKRFLREARAANAVDHPNVVEIFDAGRHDESLYLVLELLRGEPFSAYLERGAPNPTDLIRTLMPALRGVSAAHERGVVHRDLKPDNIFLCVPKRGWPGGAKVLDFGISKLRDPDALGQLTGAGTFLGSPYYMAPEQIADSSTVDERADVYSAGVMLYEGLTNSLPFDGDSLTDLFFKITNTDPRPPSVLNLDVSEALEEVVLRAMSSNPDDRYPNIRDLGLALEPFAGGVVFETLDDSIDEVLGMNVGAAMRPDAGPKVRTEQEVEEIESAPTQVSAELSEELRDSVDPEEITGERTVRRTEMDLSPPVPPARDTNPEERRTAQRDGPETERPPPPPPPPSRAMAALRGERPKDLEASPTKPLINPDAVDGAPGPSASGETTNPDVKDAEPRAGIETARTVEMNRPVWEGYTPPPQQFLERPAKKKSGVNWLAVIGASVVIAMATAVAVFFLT